jgi:lysozyme family protein
MNRAAQKPPRAAKVGPKGKVAGGLSALAIIAAITLSLDTTLDLEGGYVNDPVDPGGETNHGVTIATARESGYDGEMRELERDCDFPVRLPASIAETIEEAELEQLETDSDGETKCAAQILYEGYIERPGYVPFFVIDPWVAREVFDTAVNMGPRRPNRFFQRAVNRQCGTRLAVDGIIGPRTVKAWQDCRANLGVPVCRAMIRDLDAQQEAEYHRLIRINPRLVRFRKGWLAHRIGNVDVRQCGREMR